MKTVMKLSVGVYAALLAGMGELRAADLMCASEQQTKEIADFYGQKPGLLPALVARDMGINEMIVASALPADQATGTSGSAFNDVWSKLTDLEWAMTLVLKGGHVFEILGPVKGGEPSKRSNYFNLSGDEHFGAHLRPDLLSAIYAYSIPNAEGGKLLAVSFYGQSGESDFSIVLTAEGRTPSDADKAKFDELVAFIKSQPPVCAAQ
jgi:putative heme iron utilization protein